MHEQLQNKASLSDRAQQTTFKLLEKCPQISDRATKVVIEITKRLRFSVEGADILERIRDYQDGGVVIVANHPSVLDFEYIRKIAEYTKLFIQMSPKFSAGQMGPLGAFANSASRLTNIHFVHPGSGETSTRYVVPTFQKVLSNNGRAWIALALTRARRPGMGPASDKQLVGRFVGYHRLHNTKYYDKKPGYKELRENTWIVPTAIFGTRQVHKPGDKWRVKPWKQAVMIVGEPTTPIQVFEETLQFNRHLNQMGENEIRFEDMLMLHIGSLLPDGFEYENKVVSRKDRWGHYAGLMPIYLDWEKP